MTLLMNTIERDGKAFSRAFESAREFTFNPEAPTRLRQAVAELVASGALLPQEAGDFEDTLIMSGGRFFSALGLSPSTD
jgi:hypothetical protein